MFSTREKIINCNRQWRTLSEFVLYQRTVYTEVKGGKVYEQNQANKAITRNDIKKFI